MRDARVEALFKSEGVEFKYLEVVTLDRFDVKSSNETQSRLGKRVLPELVTQYLRKFRAKLMPPALVAYEHANRLVIMDGLHRLMAANMANIRGLPVYLVLTDDKAIIDILIRALNWRINGAKPDREQAVRQAAIWVKLFGRTVEEAARWLELSPGEVKRHITVERVRMRIEAGGGRAEGLTESQLQRLSAIGNDVVLREAVALFRKAGLTTDAQFELIALINKAERTEAAQCAVITRYAERSTVKEDRHRIERGLHLIQRTTRRRFHSVSEALDEFLARMPDFRSLQLDTSEQERIAVARMESISRNWRRLLSTRGGAQPGRATPPVPAQAAQGPTR